MSDDQVVKKRGRKQVPAERARTRSVTVRLAPAELAELEIKRGRMSRAAWLRAAALSDSEAGERSPAVPSINRHAYAELARAAANLNQLARRVNSGQHAQIAEVADALADLRRSIIGVAS